MDDCPILWEEDPAPPGVSCAEFGLTGHGRLVWGEGNPNGRLMIVLDNPGARETPTGAPYMCGTRLTLTRAAAEAGLDLPDIYVTYLVKCRPLRAYDRELAHRAGLKHLASQIRERRPAALLLLGDVVTKAVLEDESASVRTGRGAALHVDGVPAFVGYHPLAVRRRPALYPMLIEDMERIRAMLLSVHGPPIS